MDKTKHLVSVIVPCYNEENTIQLLLNSILKQDFPIRDVEVVISDAFSQDKTREKIMEFTQAHPELAVKVVDNPQCTIPAAVNAAAQASDGEYLVRLDAHSMPYPDYISTCVRDLQAGKGTNVGGVWEIRPGTDSGIARAIAAAAANPLAVGDARYRFSNQEGEVDTVPFGSFRRDLFFEIGGFDESLLTNEDYEFNVRIRKQGGKIWFDPNIRCIYFARKNLNELAKQYWRYGFWKFKMLKRYPDTLRWRQALPPVFVLVNALGILLSPFFGWIILPYLSVLGLYCLILLLAGVREAIRRSEPGLIFFLPAAIMTMHFAWGAGFLMSILTKK
ncbi:MAG TPA: glycosyltransferase family 2 protein [Anaerolineaceae bacterium]|nr:glycosyltransferase family 2 protein [Anaerolineaceae bacterium]